MASANVVSGGQSSQAKPPQRRPITSCLECYRRKQRCNRRQPCNQCMFRKIPEQCIFGSDIAPMKGISQKRHVLGPKARVEGQLVDHTSSSAKTAGDVQADTSTNSGADAHFQVRNGWDNQLFPPACLPSDPRSNLQNVYCGLVEQLPSGDIAQQLLDFFFKDLYWGAMTVDENHFFSMYHKWQTICPSDHLRGCEDGLQRELQCFPALLFQMLAQALYALPLQHVAASRLGLANQEASDRLSEAYHINGNRLVQLLGRHQPTLCSVENDLLAFCWLKNAGRYSEAWYRLGGAVRQAQGLGLHRLPQSVRQTPENSLESNLMKIWDLELQKRIWAKLFILDSTVALVLERPRFLHREDCSVSMPLNCDYPKDPTRTIPVPSGNGEFAKASHSLTLAHKMHEIISLSVSKSLPPDYSKVMQLHKEVCGLRDRLLSSWDIDPNDVSSNMAISKLDLKCLLSLNQIERVLFTLHRPYMKTQSLSHMETVNAALRHLDLQYAILELIPGLQRRFYENPFHIIDLSIFVTGPSGERALTNTIGQDVVRKLGVRAAEHLAAIKRLNPAPVSNEQVSRQCCQKLIDQADWPAWEALLVNSSGSTEYQGSGAPFLPQSQYSSEQFSSLLSTSYPDHAVGNIQEPTHTLRESALDGFESNSVSFQDFLYEF